MRWIFNFATHPSREARSWSSERGGEPNEEALVKLGSEKLARLVIGEAKRNAAFRKLVAAALAASKRLFEKSISSGNTLFYNYRENKCTLA
jgi:hypothetical protein